MNTLDALLREPNGTPPVHPHLIEHLRAKFPRTLVNPVQAARIGLSYNEAAAHDNSVQIGAEIVIDYLETLVNPGQENSPPSRSDIAAQEENTNEPTPPEGDSTDPRRPGARDRS